MEKKKRGRGGKLKGKKYLPTELWKEVFASLPVKTLLRFRCVCKHWCSLIDDDAHDLHRNRNITNNSRFIVMEDLQSTCRITLRRSDTFRKTAQLLETTTKYYFLGFYHGLVLLVPYYPEAEVRIWNPSIRKSLLLPYCRRISFSGIFFIGFSHRLNDFKIFHLSHFYPPACHCLSYKLRGTHNQWILNNIPWNRKKNMVLPSHPIIAQGAAHWMMCDLDLCPQGNKFTHCLSFHIDSEQLCAVKLPDNDMEMFMWIFTLGDSLALFGFSSSNWLIWVMEKDGDQMLWKLTSSGCFPSHAYKLLSVYKFSDKFTFEESSGTIFLLSPYGKRKGVVSYNLKTQQIKHLGKSIRHSIRYLDAHEESLVLVRGPQSPMLTTFP